MKVYYAGMPLPERGPDGVIHNSVFLAGPTPRTSAARSWRPAAMDLLEEQGFQGSVFVPETAGLGWLKDYKAQITGSGPPWGEPPVSSSGSIANWSTCRPSRRTSSSALYQPSHQTDWFWGLRRRRRNFAIFEPWRKRSERSTRASDRSGA